MPLMRWTEQPAIRGRLGILVLLVALAGCDKHGNDSQVISRTSGTEWDVVILGVPTAPRLPIVSTEVSFEARRKGRVDASPASGRLFKAYWLDDNFTEKYEPAVWLSPQLLVLQGRARRSGQLERLIVRNETLEPVAWLRVRTEDLFLILDLGSKQETTLTSRGSGGGFAIGVSGGFSANRSLTPAAANFDEARGEYRVVIRDGGVTITGSADKQPQ
jgi:hypothetical protein